ncbi:hypothetical protein Zmor_009157 [Zophobas morio]|uniref:Uncharacterized protein n=1 Tax=Zophobas morio TaxID=2755281 RepID=A0AA38IIF2_9CUCU|nr:hypothetical protein Zmor_009142 [Zophobas morio]KAJ3657347.1 hypothetical protein Zmor_009157 [Zophobas morio]
MVRNFRNLIRLFHLILDAVAFLCVAGLHPARSASACLCAALLEHVFGLFVWKLRRETRPYGGWMAQDVLFLVSLTSYTLNHRTESERGDVGLGRKGALGFIEPEIDAA